MKRVILILSLILISFIGYTGNDNVSTPSATTNNSTEMLIESLRPITPIEATFEEDTIKIDTNILKPVTPTVATFED
jgi:hypothetical protein